MTAAKVQLVARPVSMHLLQGCPPVHLTFLDGETGAHARMMSKVQLE